MERENSSQSENITNNNLKKEILYNIIPGAGVIIILGGIYCLIPGSHINLNTGVSTFIIFGGFAVAGVGTIIKDKAFGIKRNDQGYIIK